MSKAQRIQEIVDYYGMSYNSFAISLGMLNGTSIKRIVDDNRNPQNQTLNKIVNTYSEINYEWLTTGHGNMIKGDNLTKEIDEDDLTVTARQILNKLEEDRIHYDSTRRELDKERLNLQMQILNKKFEELEEKMDANATKRAAGVSKVIGQKMDIGNKYWIKRAEEKDAYWHKENKEQKNLFLTALDKVLIIEQDLENIKSFMAVGFENEAIKKADKKTAKKLAKKLSTKKLEKN